jgi:nucleoside-diphosphate-sugar epimerase
MKKHYLITGGNGYIGQNMYWKNWASDISVDFTICDKHTPLPQAQDLTEAHLEGFDGVIHLAALSGIFACEEGPAFACIDNIMTAGNVFKIATKLGIPVVFTSSQAAKDPKSSVYAQMKWTCENIANYYNTYGGKNYVVRLANVYGGDSYLKKKKTCVKQFITQYSIKEPFKIHGDGQQKRDFVHCHDVCEAIYRIIAEQPDYEPYTDPIDIGTGKGTTILELRNMFPSHPCEFVSTRNAGAESSVADTSTLEKLTGFKPERKLEDYIKEMSNGS